MIIADKKIPEEAKAKLSEFGEIVIFSTANITYDAISGHPDVFFCKLNDRLIVAPNLPAEFKNILSGFQISFVEGESPVGLKYPESARYNALSNDHFLIHNFRYTDSVITQNSGDLDLIHVNQGYTRCNLLALGNRHFITSDEGIYRVLKNQKMDVLFAEPKGILLPGHRHGFFGGACGVFINTVFIVGKLSFYPAGDLVRNYLHKLNFEIIELYEGPVFDVGGLLFL